MSATFMGGAIADRPADVVVSGPLIIALQWLALNRGRLSEIVRAGSASS